MKTMTILLPDSLDMSEREVTLSLAAMLYEEGRLSIGQAADLAGLTKRTFIELLGKLGVSFINYPPSDLPADVANA